MEYRAEREIVRTRKMLTHAIDDARRFAERNGKAYWVHDRKTGLVAFVADPEKLKEGGPWK